jgi:hypothetical protein
VVLKAYLMLRTPNRTSNELVDVIRQHYKQHFLAGGTVYGWYDVFIELDVPNQKKLTTIKQELLHDHLNVTHIDTAVERTSDPSLGIPVLWS